MDIDDMINLDNLSEETILNNLQSRYDKKKIYTYTGSILVAMNPFAPMDIYEKNILKSYFGSKKDQKAPHIFATAEAAYAKLKDQKANQAVIISGESGAGKTESTKLILQYITSATSNTQTWIEEQVMEANTILESLGNAKTVRNNNSSRFGKFVQLHLDKNCKIVGAAIVSYLLEKSRIAFQAQNERNYHIFYQLCNGATQEEQAKYQLAAPESFHYLNKSGCISLPSIPDKEGFQSVKLAFNVMQMNPDTMDQVFMVLSAILHLGNMQFVDNESSVEVKSLNELQIVASLLQCDQEKLKEALCTRKLTVRGETTLVPLKLNQAMENKDSIAKAIYDRLFSYVVSFINSKTKTNEGAQNFIGVLDIFGFELFEFNSFEQFCINFANEKLQQFFNQFVFKLEQEEYAKEGIKWDSINFVDNQECIALIEGKLGVLALLDEESKFPNGTDDSWLSKLHDKLKADKYYVKPSMAGKKFGIKHYAGEVMYTVTGFLDKNKDNIQPEIVELFSAAKMDLVKTLFSQSTDQAAEKGGKKTSAGYFKGQLQSLVSTLSETTPHYVRCIKPNKDKKAFVFENDMVMAQLKYCGMLDTIKIRKSGYAQRIPYDAFVAKYRCINPNAKGGSTKETTMVIMKSMAFSKPDGWQAGNSKLFLKMDCNDALEDKWKLVVSISIVKIQKQYRCYYHAKRYKKIQKSICHIQKYVKMLIYRRRYVRTRKAIIVLQSGVRGWFARDLYRALKAKKAPPPVEVPKTAAENQLSKIAAAIKDQKSNAKGEEGVDDLFAFLTVFENVEAEVPQENEAISNEIDSMFVKTAEAPLAQAEPKMLRSNPLLAKAENEPEKTSKDSLEDIKEDDWRLEIYVEEHMVKPQEPKKGMLSIRKTKPTNEKMINTLRYSNNLITGALLRGSQDTNIEAIDINKNLLKVVECKKKDDVIANIKAVIDYGMTIPSLRDEIFLQICKIVIPPEKQPKNWQALIENGWFMMATCLCCFPPSKGFYQYFYVFLRKTKRDNEKDENSITFKFAKYCISTLKEIRLAGVRKAAPTLEEVLCVSKLEPLTYTVYFAGGDSREFKIKPTLTAGDLVKEIARQLQLKDTGSWSLYEFRGEEYFIIKSTEFMADRLASLKGNEVEGKKGGGKSLLIFKRRLFRNAVEMITNSSELYLLYPQILNAVLNDAYQMTEKTAIQVAAFICHIKYGNYKEDPSRLRPLSGFIPPSLISLHSEGEWHNLILESQTKLEKQTPIQTKSLFLEAIKGVKGYGSTRFIVSIKGFWSYPETILLSISDSNINFVHMKNKTVLLSYTYDQISSWDVEDGALCFAFESSLEESVEDQNSNTKFETLKFVTPQAEEIVSLLKEYSPVQKSSRKKNALNLASLDLRSAAAEVDKARKALMQKMLVRVPCPVVATKAGTMKDTIRKISRKQVMGSKEQLNRSNPELDTIEEDWVFAKGKLSSSISKKDDPGFITTAIMINSGLSVFSGLTQISPEEAKTEGMLFAPTVQRIIDAALKSPDVANELYLQLTKQTTNHPEPDCQIVLRFWKFMAVAIGVVLPTGEVLELVRAHLRRVAISENQKRKKEIAIAMYCLGTLLSRSSSPRIYPPSSMEILLSAKTSPLHTRFYFLDGQFRAIQFDRKANFGILFDQLRKKMNATMEGFAFYRFTAGQEQFIKPETNVCDAMFEMERAIVNSGKQYNFLIKKRLWMDSQTKTKSTLEENLLMFQAMDDIRWGRYPVTPDMASRLAALRIFCEVGSNKSDAQINFGNVARMFPKEVTLNQAAVEKEFKSLAGKSIDACNEEFMAIIRRWTLYGTTFYSIVQSYTDKIPSACWLGVNKFGIHIIARLAPVPLVSHSYSTINTMTPSDSSIMIVVDDGGKNNKYVLQTNQAQDIILHVNAYRDMQK